MNKEQFEDSLDHPIEQSYWDTEQIIKPVSEWHEEDGPALFFRLDAGEPPEVTSPITDGYDSDYFTHWTPLPDMFGMNNAYRMACIKSGIPTTVKRIGDYN